MTVRTALVLLALLLGAACSSGAATEVDLRVLAEQQEAWDGRVVQVTGVLRTHDAPEHYWVEDDAQHRVELVPDDGLAMLVGRRVTARGRFTFREDEGRRIEVDSLVRADDP